MPSPHSLRTISNLEPGDHLCHLYSTEEEHRTVLIPFILNGLERREKVLCITDAHGQEAVCGCLRDSGLDVEPYIDRGQLSILTSDESYLLEGIFDPDRMITLLRSETERIQRQGYSALRVIGEMIWTLRETPGSDRLIEYEARLNDFFPGSTCLGICQYDRRRFDPALLLDILTTHPLAVIGTEIVENFYYVPSGDVGNSGPAAGQLQRWMDNLVVRKQAVEALGRQGEHLKKTVEKCTAQLRSAREGIQQEIAEREQTEKALRESEAQHRELVQNVNSIILRMDYHGHITFFNEFAQKFFGFSEDEIIGRNVVGTIVPETDISGRDLAAMIADIGRHPERYITNENENMRSNGERVWVAWTNKAVFDKKGNVVETLCIGNDITERKRLESQLVQAQKMEAVGTLAGGIAHDFNNLLQTIQGYAEFFLSNKKSDAGYQAIKGIVRSVKKGAELTNQLLTFSRKVESKLRPVNLNHEVKEVKKLLIRTIPKMITIKLKLANDLKGINADPTQIEQVLMNMAINSRDAMPDGGRLIIKTGNMMVVEDHTLTHTGAQPGEYVLLSVSDTGHGMNKETMEHMFEPFYTTKEPGKGTGLGLAMVYGLVKSHGGYIRCSSECGKGTTFTIYFPVINKEVTAEETEKHVEIPQDGTETILLADDEKSIRDFGRNMLSRHGYTVLTAADGESALRVYQQKKKEIALVILDLIMPGIGGKRCAQELCTIDPNAKILIASGHSFGGPLKETPDPGYKGFINKPYEIEEVLKAIRAVLDQD